MRKIIFAMMGAMCMMGVLHASYLWEYAPGRQCEIGGDLRLRLTSWDREVLPPNLVAEEGSAVQYVRMRTRIWGCFNITEDVDFTVRAVNRWHHFSSSFRNPNNQGAATWRFPDELIFDNIYLDVRNLMDSNWSLRLGRQDVMLGNGMVVLESTPYDQGRAIYFDGAVATYKSEKNTLKLLALFNNYKDPIAINDQDRRLRRGDSWLVGAYWTHQLQPSLNTDLYYLFVDIDDTKDDEWEPGEFNHPVDENAEFHVVGGRVFGSMTPQVDYSLELARQFGERSNDKVDMTGMMGDARLTLRASEGTKWSPALGLSYTYFSGDDTDSSKFEGWHPVFAEYPIWREELLAIKFNANWQNIHQYRTSLILHLRDEERFPVTFTTAWAYLRADEKDTPKQVTPAATAGGQGNEMGHLLSAFLDVGLTSDWTVSLEAAQFFAGDYYADRDNSKWLRFQTIYRF